MAAKKSKKLKKGTKLQKADAPIIFVGGGEKVQS
jgi:hypothetical protein